MNEIIDKITNLKQNVYGHVINTGNIETIYMYDKGKGKGKGEGKDYERLSDNFIIFYKDTYNKKWIQTGTLYRYKDDDRDLGLQIKVSSNYQYDNINKSIVDKIREIDDSFIHDYHFDQNVLFNCPDDPSITYGQNGKIYCEVKNKLPYINLQNEILSDIVSIVILSYH